MIIIETGVWIDYFRKKETPQTRWLVSNESHAIGSLDVTLCEVLQGAISQRLFTDIRRKLLSFPVLNTGGVWLMLATAENYRALRSRGVTVRSTIDCIIATYCIEHGHTLLHQDRDFRGFEEHLKLSVVPLDTR